jgi:hypothetical protein
MKLRSLGPFFCLQPYKLKYHFLTLVRIIANNSLLKVHKGKDNSCAFCSICDINEMINCFVNLKHLLGQWDNMCIFLEAFYKVKIL